MVWLPSCEAITLRSFRSKEIIKVLTLSDANNSHRRKERFSFKELSGTHSGHRLWSMVGT